MLLIKYCQCSLQNVLLVSPVHRSWESVSDWKAPSACIHLCAGRSYIRWAGYACSDRSPGFRFSTVITKGQEIKTFTHRKKAAFKGILDNKHVTMWYKSELWRRSEALKSSPSSDCCPQCPDDWCRNTAKLHLSHCSTGASHCRSTENLRGQKRETY